MKPVLPLMFLLSGIALYLCACNKDANDIYIAPKQARLNVINATDYIFNVYQNGTRLTSSANINPGSGSGYITVSAGNQRFSVKKPIDGQAANPQLNTDTTISEVIKLDSGSRYSMFVSGTDDKAKVFSFAETIPAAVSTTALVRFIHASTVAGTITVSLNDVVISANRSYHYIGDFASIGTFPSSDPVQKTLKIYQGSNTTPVYTQVLSFAAGAIYTLFARDAPGNTISIGQITNQ